jgi:hypothetical protein
MSHPKLGLCRFATQSAHFQCRMELLRRILRISGILHWRRFILSLRPRFLFFALVLGIAPVVIAQSAPLDKQRMIQVIQNYVG